MGKTDKDTLTPKYQQRWTRLAKRYNAIADSGTYLDLNELHVSAAVLLMNVFNVGFGPEPTEPIKKGLTAYHALVRRAEAEGGQFSYTHTIGWIPFFGAEDPSPIPPPELLTIYGTWLDYVDTLINDDPDFFRRDAIARIVHNTRQGERITLQAPDKMKAIKKGKAEGGITDADRMGLNQQLADYAKRAAVVYAEACEYIADLIGNVCKPRWSKPMSLKAMAEIFGWDDYRKVKRVYGDHIEDAPGQKGHKALKQIDINKVPDDFRDDFTEA